MAGDDAISGRLQEHKAGLPSPPLVRYSEKDGTDVEPWVHRLDDDGDRLRPTAS